LFTGDAAKRLGTFCCEHQFDLTRLRDLRPKLLEVGRSCVDLDYRTSAALAILWSAVVRFGRERGATHVLGCVNASMTDGDISAAAMHVRLASDASLRSNIARFCACAWPPFRPSVARSPQ
jgi:putative hemolysin